MILLPSITIAISEYHGLMGLKLLQVVTHDSTALFPVLPPQKACIKFCKVYWHYQQCTFCCLSKPEICSVI